MLNILPYTAILTSIVFGIGRSSNIEVDEPSIATNFDPGNAIFELHKRLQTLENLRVKDGEESAVLKKTVEMHQNSLDKALAKISTIKREFGKLKNENIRLHSRLDKVLLQNAELLTQCEKTCKASETLSPVQESTDTLGLDLVFPDNITAIPGDSIKTEPQTVPQETVAAKLADTLRSKPRGAIRRSPEPLQGMKRVAEIDLTAGGRGFFAKTDHVLPSVSVGHTIIFNYVITNTHNDYSSYTGGFTCGTPGLYVFSWTIQINIHWLKSELLKNGRAIAEGYSGDDRQYFTTGTNTAVLSLVKGDLIVVHVSGRPGSINIQPHVTSFSGYLV